jgi:hypothetical protein
MCALNFCCFSRKDAFFFPLTAPLMIITTGLFLAFSLLVELLGASSSLCAIQIFLDPRDLSQWTLSARRSRLWLSYGTKNVVFRDGSILPLTGVANK